MVLDGVIAGISNVPVLFAQFAVEDLIYQWESWGVYQFLLPFLLIFAVVFGILSYMGLFGKNKGIHIIISIVIGLLAIRTPLFADFLREISPRLGVGLVIILAALILVGLFVPKAARGIILWMLFGIGALVFIIILIQMYNIFLVDRGFVGGIDSGQVIPIMVLIGLFIAIVVAISVGKGSRGDDAWDEAKHLAGRLFRK
jgi:hypothetical protein